VKLRAANLFVHTVNEIDRFSMKFVKTICCRVKSSMSPMAERQLQAFANVEVGGPNGRSLFPRAESKASVMNDPILFP
jgi:hypothetical protein